MVARSVTTGISASRVSPSSNMTPGLSRICHAFRNLMVSGIGKCDRKTCLPGHMKLYDVSRTNHTYSSIQQRRTSAALPASHTLLSSLSLSGCTLTYGRYSLHPAAPAGSMVDPTITPIPFYDCPVTTGKELGFDLPFYSPAVISKEDPVSLLNEWIIELPVAIQAKNILKIRRKKMNRHRLKKFRKRMRFVRRKQLHARRKKKEKIFSDKLAAIVRRGEEFDAEDFMQEKLALARKGGYKIDIFGS